MKAERSGPGHFRLLFSAFPVCALLVFAGCNNVPAEKFQDVQREVQRLQEENKQLQQQLAEQRATIENLQDKIRQLSGIEVDRLEYLVYPVKIKLEQMSGGYDRDDQPGDDGVVLYIQPIDRDGHVIKAAGELSVSLLDMHDPASPVVIASYEFDVQKTRDLWYGQLMTDHFTVRCPWPPSGPPEHAEITAEVRFTVLLTGKTLKARNVYQVVLPSEAKENTDSTAK